MQLNISHLFTRVASRLISKWHDRPLPPATGIEKTRIDSLREQFRGLSSDGILSEPAWAGYVQNLKRMVLNDDPRRFLRWPVVLESMFVNNFPYVERELEYLKRHAHWQQRWQPAIKESGVGHPTPYWRYPQSSGNLIHHAYHIARFEDTTALPITAFDLIFEFGGGYGSMCRLTKNLGFNGRYLIFDLPHFSLLQRFFFESHGWSVLAPEQFATAQRGILTISQFEQLEHALLARRAEARSLFIATWSLSESPEALRSKILALLDNFTAVLIAYQDSFAGVDNNAYFSAWQAGQRHYVCREQAIAHLPGSQYLFCWRS